MKLKTKRSCAMCSEIPLQLPVRNLPSFLRVHTVDNEAHKIIKSCENNLQLATLIARAKLRSYIPMLN